MPEVTERVHVESHVQSGWRFPDGREVWPPYSDAADYSDDDWEAAELIERDMTVMRAWSPTRLFREGTE